MRYVRTALAAATALLTLTTLAATAHADDHGKDNGNLCYIQVEGNHNHNACGSIKYGNNATTGQGHTVVSPPEAKGFAVFNNSRYSLRLRQKTDNFERSPAVGSQPLLPHSGERNEAHVYWLTFYFFSHNPGTAWYDVINEGNQTIGQVIIHMNVDPVFGGTTIECTSTVVTCRYNAATPIGANYAYVQG
ncbi:hypothetical protein [Streptomyces sp. NPDC086023]|uniref:hypothetical protein n=1 Tax=Streptomyces sp. NPDC086023 TaxID=3365746 RepID=UPI0037D5B37E